MTFILNIGNILNIINLAKLMGNHIAGITSLEHLSLGLQTPKTSVVYMQEYFKLYPLSSNSIA